MPHRVGDGFLRADAAQMQDIVFRLFLDDIHDVIHHQRANQAAVIINHRGGNQVVLLKLVGNVGLFLDDVEHRLLVIHDVGDLLVAAGPQHPGQRQHALQVKAGINHIDFHEVIGNITRHPHMVNGLPHRPELRHRHKLRLHQTASRIFRVIQGAVQRRTVLLGNLGEDFILLGLVHVLNEIQRVIGIELLDGRGDHVIGQRLHKLVAHRLIELGQRFHVEVAAQGCDQLDAVGLFQMLNKIGQVSRMQLARDGAHQLHIVGGQNALDARQELRRNGAPLITHPHIALLVRHIANP